MFKLFKDFLFFKVALLLHGNSCTKLFSCSNMHNALSREGSAIPKMGTRTTLAPYFFCVGTFFICKRSDSFAHNYSMCFYRSYNCLFVIICFYPTQYKEIT